MSVTRAVTGSLAEVPVSRRVRHEARDAVSVMGVSAGLSASVALLLLLLTSLGR